MFSKSEKKKLRNQLIKKIKRVVESDNFGYVIDFQGHKINVLEDIVWFTWTVDPEILNACVNTMFDEVSMDEAFDFLDDHDFFKESLPLIWFEPFALGTMDNSIIYWALQKENFKSHYILATIITNTLTIVPDLEPSNMLKETTIHNIMIRTFGEWLWQYDIVDKAAIDKHFTSQKFPIDEKDLKTYLDFKKNIITAAEYRKILASYHGSINFDTETHLNMMETIIPIIKKEYPDYDIEDFKKLDKDTQKFIYVLSQEVCKHLRIVVDIAIKRAAICYYYLANAEKLNNLENEVKRKEELLNRAEERIKIIKVKSHNFEKDLENNKALLKEVKFQLNTQINEYEKLKSSGIHDTTILDNKIHKQEKEITELKEKVFELNRMISKREATINSLLSANDELIKSLEQKESKILSLIETNKSITTETIFSGIPIECYVNFIKKKKIILAGGDVMHNHLKELGLTNIKMIPASVSKINTYDVMSQDLIVIATTFIQHQLSYRVKEAAIRYNINYINFNNRNVEQLIKEIFIFFTTLD